MITQENVMQSALVKLYAEFGFTEFQPELNLQTDLRQNANSILN